MQPLTQNTGMSPASVTLASALQVRGEALSEEEIWSLLYLAAERLLEDIREDSSDYVVCPWSALLSAAGSLSFQNHISHIEAAPFKAPELLQEQRDDEQPDVSQVHVYSLGMTLYWSAGFHVPQNQPLQLREPLSSILLTMCEDQPRRRLPLQSVLEACRVHWEEVAVYPTSAGLHVRRLAGLVLGTISEVERRLMEESSLAQQDRSCLLRHRLHQASCENTTVWALERLHPCRVSERSTETQSSLEPGLSTSVPSHHSLSVSSAFPVEVPPNLQEGPRLSSSTALSVAAEISQPATPSQRAFLQRKGKFSRPEFVLLAGEAPVTVHLPGSIVTKKGKSYLALRALCVVLLSGQCLEVKCDIMSTAGAVFSAVMSFVNLGELTYFGLAYMKDKEFFFLDDETRLCKIAPEGWSEQPQKKTSSNTFTLFLRIKFFVSCCAQLQNSQARHQFYLQLRKDILEGKLYCNDETLLQLAVLALQAEFGNYPEEQIESKAYFRVEDYIPASLIERMTAFRLQVEVSEMHRLSPVLWGEDAELEFLRVTQKLPEYGVLVHRVLPEKMTREREMALGICAKGIIVYEVKNNSRIATLRFQWREIGKISTCRKKFTITSGITGKKHTFVTDSAKTCKYLLGLCSAQHGFNAQMSFLPVAAVSDHDKCVQMANTSLAHLVQSQPLTWIQRLSDSENALFTPAPGPEVTAGGLQRLSLDNFTLETSKETAARGIRGSPCMGREQLETISLIQKPTTRDRLSGPPVPSVHREPQSNRRKSFIAEPEREIVHVTLRRDPRRGFGFVINEGEDVGKVDPGIFISSIIPGGPAEKAKRIKPGGQILALNHISLEGFTFDMAVRMIQNSPESIELTISQSKGICGNTPSEEKNSPANSGVFSTDSPSNRHLGSFSSHAQDQEKNTEELEMAQTQSLLSRGQDAGTSCPPPPSEINASEIYFVELVKEDGTLGFSVTGGINTSVPYGGIYVKSIVSGGPAAKEGQILRGDRLLQVDGVSLCGLTHKQAVQCLKGSGQVARLVLERRGPRTTQQCPSVNGRMADGCTAVSLATALPGRPASCVSATDGPKFEVTLKKNASGLGFSFMQMERESCSHLKNDLVRIKRLFPGQPAEENGAIAVGDIILAVNGRPTEGLVFQEVLHLLRGASQEVTLLLCRPPPGALPEIDQGWQTPVLSADKEFTRATCTDSEQSPSLDQEDSRRDSASPDTGESLGPGPEPFQKATGKAQWDQDIERPWATSSMRPQDSPPHLCRLQQEMDASTLATSLERDMRQNCYSVCDMRGLERFSYSPSLTRLSTDIF
ncbi:FERM and PDZ domain-containing protein 2 isoform X1 [Herpailurus yagouaroundi]|uniref:FERM and PDZ domain-containing protein 2 isoform X1 n=3 Tax=Herpailurus yagouaroundi TaxID=1608482 RepID=UPI001AD73C15|nr:FERM and PDZ domain-containing protein 2 isoform X1 [Puma yagouaroundi]XP_040341610.1 FERM and PDZ domain-containing protein 2 isoform X1 [Puma yagouaroundi]XP_040341611.1 FERM and PDZ domain-containing protein 2 isoform X1 [Puma yagouaroundi]